MFASRAQIPENGVQIVLPDQGRCNLANLCFRSDQQWSCDTGICQIKPENQNLTLLTGQMDKNCRCAPLQPEFIDQVSTILEVFHSNDKLSVTYIEWNFQVCQTKSIIAQKVIRLCDIGHIQVIREKIPDLKVILLFRDPRGIFGSRKRLVSPSLLSKTVNSILTDKNLIDF